MKLITTRGARSLALLALCATVAACGLPRSGPNKREIFAGSVLREGDAFIVTVNPRVTRATSVMASPMPSGVPARWGLTPSTPAMC